MRSWMNYYVPTKPHAQSLAKLTTRSREYRRASSQVSAARSAGGVAKNGAMRRLALLFLLLLAVPAHAQTENDVIRPSARPRFQVVDGDTVKFGPQLVRLFGIDAPEKGQACDDGKWHPGPLAEKALADFIAGRPVICKQVATTPGMTIPWRNAFAGEDDLQAMMVSADWAWSFGRYSERYTPLEREAVTRKAGVHGQAAMVGKPTLLAASEALRLCSDSDATSPGRCGSAI